jgi:hypothetical protein
MSLIFKILFAFTVTGIFFSCNRSGIPDQDSATAGIITIVADSSIKHMLDQQVFVFGTMYKYAAIVTEYLPGEKAYERLRNDSIRMVIGLEYQGSAPYSYDRVRSYGIDL